MEIRRTLSCLSFSVVLCPIRAISTAIVQIHHGLRRFFRRPFANHAKTNSYPLNTRNDAKEEDKWDDTRSSLPFRVIGVFRGLNPRSFAIRAHPCHLSRRRPRRRIRGYTFGCGGAPLGHRRFWG